MINKRPGAAAPLGRLAFVAALALASLIVARPAAADMNMIGNCDVTGTKGQFPLTPAKPGQITVEVNLPAPGWWNGVQRRIPSRTAMNTAWRPISPGAPGWTKSRW